MDAAFPFPAGTLIETDGLVVRAEPKLGFVLAGVADPAEAARLGEVVGRALPERSGPSEGAASPTALWRTPKQWLILADSDDAAHDLVRRIGAVFPDGRAHAVRQSDQVAALAIEGTNAHSLLTRGTLHALDEAAFLVGSSRRLAFGAFRIQLFRRSPAAWLILAERSSSPSLLAWLKDAATS